jgi:phosphohistidine phosphatase SixA
MTTPDTHTATSALKARPIQPRTSVVTHTLCRATPVAAVCALVSTLAVAQPASPPVNLVTAPTPEFKEALATPALLKALRKGGYVLYMRHGNTNNDHPDQPNLKLDDCATQRPLNDEGRAVVTQVGKAIAQAHIPVGDVWVSPMCRAKESAQLAFGNKAQVDVNLMYTAHMTTEQKKPILANTRRLLSEAVAPGTNRVVVAHAPNLADLMGFFVKPEGNVVVFTPLGNQQFRYEASIHPQHWATLLK